MVVVLRMKVWPWKSAQPQLRGRARRANQKTFLSQPSIVLFLKSNCQWQKYKSKSDNVPELRLELRFPRFWNWSTTWCPNHLDYSSVIMECICSADSIMNQRWTHSGCRKRPKCECKGKLGCCAVVHSLLGFTLSWEIHDGIVEALHFLEVLFHRQCSMFSSISYRKLGLAACESFLWMPWGYNLKYWKETNGVLWSNFCARYGNPAALRTRHSQRLRRDLAWTSEPSVCFVPSLSQRTLFNPVYPFNENFSLAIGNSRLVEISGKRPLCQK